MKNNEKTNHFSNIFLITTIPLSMAFLYSAGRAFSMGYLTEFGIQNDLAYLSVDRILFEGLLALTRGIDFIFYTAFYIIFLSLVFILISILSETHVYKKLFNNKNRLSLNKNTFDIAAIFLNNTALYITSIFPLLFILFMWLNELHDKGEKDAKENKIEFQKVFSQWNKGKKINNAFFSRLYKPANNIPEYGFVILANPSHIFFYTQKGIKIYPTDTVRLEQV